MGGGQAAWPQGSFRGSWEIIFLLVSGIGAQLVYNKPAGEASEQLFGVTGWEIEIYIYIYTQRS